MAWFGGLDLCGFGYDRIAESCEHSNKLWDISTKPSSFTRDGISTRLVTVSFWKSQLYELFKAGWRG